MSFSIRLVHCDFFWPMEIKCLGEGMPFPHFVPWTGWWTRMGWWYPYLGPSSHLLFGHDAGCVHEAPAPLPTLCLGQGRAHISPLRGIPRPIVAQGKHRKSMMGQSSPLPWPSSCQPGPPAAHTVATLLSPVLAHGLPLSSPQSRPINSQRTCGQGSLLISVLLEAFE